MFRELRKKRQQLSPEECELVLRESPRGVMAVQGDDDYPYTVPLNFYYNPENQHIYFHGAKKGHKIDAMKRNDKVSFCVLGTPYHQPDDWAWTVRSVIVFGRIHFIEDREEHLKAISAIGLKYFPDAQSAAEAVKKSGNDTLCYELIPEQITGKIVREG